MTQKLKVLDYKCDRINLTLTICIYAIEHLVANKDKIKCFIFNFWNFWYNITHIHTKLPEKKKKNYVQPTGSW